MRLIYQPGKIVRMTTTSPLPPLVAYYGSLIEERPTPEYVNTLHEAEQVIHSLVTPYGLRYVTHVREGEFLGDYIVMIPIPWVLPQSFGDDEFTFECE